MVTLLSHYYIIALCHIISLSRYHYIIITITISIYQFISYHISLYHNIILSLCPLPLSVTMTIIHATDTDWLPPHDTTTRYDSRSTHNKAIWGKKD